MTVTTQPLPGAVIAAGPQPWQVLQREQDGCAPVTLAGHWVGDAPSVVEVRVAGEYDNAPVAGCDWREAEMLDDQAWRITLRVPTGGLYRLETRVRNPGMRWRMPATKSGMSRWGFWVINGRRRHRLQSAGGGPPRSVWIFR